MKRIITTMFAALVCATAAFADDSANRVLTHPTGNHVSCKDFGYPTDGVFAENGTNGTYNKDHNGNTLPVSVTIFNYVAGSGQNVATFSFHATTGISAVFVKAGSNHEGQNLYTYSSPVGADTGLASPKPSISHVLFCYCGTTAVQTYGFTATRHNSVVRLRWHGNAAGYNVYRGSTKLNKSLLSGRQFVVRNRNVAQYRLQSVSLNGARAWVATATS